MCDSLVCTECNKAYTNRRNLLKHKRDIHKSFEREKREKKDEENCYYCKNCDKNYKNIQSRWRHEKTCKPIVDIVTQNNIQQEMDILKKQVQELQQKLHSHTLDTKTFRAINKILIDRSLKNSNNNTVNNYKIYALGGEELKKALTDFQKSQIMNSRLCSIEKIVEITHCGEMNQFKNIIITNLKDNFAYRYDDTKGYFITCSKTDLLDDIVNNRMMDIEAIYDELKYADQIDNKTKKLIQDFIDRMDDTGEPFYDNETKYDNFRSFKTHKIKILLYNNKDKITKDIALWVSTDSDPDNMLRNEITYT